MLSGEECIKKHDINTFMHVESHNRSAYNQENDFCLTAGSDLILKPLTANLCLQPFSHLWGSF